MKISTLRRFFNLFNPVVLGTTATITAVLASHSALAQTPSLSDVDQSYWARPFIERLAKEEIIAGFPDGTFKPNQPVTRSQFAAIVRNAFNKGAVRNSRTFSDVAAKYWAASAIDKAYITGFLSGYPDGTFKPEQQIPKVQALISLASGLQLDAPSDLGKTLEVFRDASEIPDYARKGAGAATQKTLVVNYPNVAFLNPNDVATRADIAAFVYQALVNQGKMSALPSSAKAVAYIVNYKGQPSDGNNNGDNDNPGKRLVSQGTILPVALPGGKDVRLILVPDETIQTTFEVSQSITGPKGGVLIPVGSKVEGQFRPSKINNTIQGTQYFANKLTIAQQTYSINATSNPLAPSDKQSLSPGLLQGGLATTAAQVLLGTLLGGGVNVGTLLGGVLSDGNTLPVPKGNNSVIVVRPSKLVLTVQSDFQVAHQLQNPLSGKVAQILRADR